MNYPKRLIPFLVIGFAIALIPPFLLLAMFRNIQVSQILRSFQFSLIYSYTIGALAFSTLPKIWPAVQKYPAWLAWGSRVLTILSCTLLGCLIACGFFVLLGWVPSGEYWSEFTNSLKIAIFLSVLVSVSFGMYESFQYRLQATTLELRTKELERERALKLATEAQLASLESRIHPHFLFNTLNSISSLIPEDPKRAERLLEQMAALLRFSLDSNHAGLVPLASELKIVGDYLEIERARFGDRLRYSIDLAGDLNGARVPPLAVQTLVENSVKFAIAPSRVGGEIRIAGAKDNGRLRVEVSDDGPGFTLETAPAGHGLDNLKNRLAALFGDQGALLVERRENWNSVRLVVPQNGKGNESLSR